MVDMAGIMCLGLQLWWMARFLGSSLHSISWDWNVQGGVFTHMSGPWAGWLAGTAEAGWVSLPVQSMHIGFLKAWWPQGSEPPYIAAGFS